jgi:hypothetical protein
MMDQQKAMMQTPRRGFLPVTDRLLIVPQDPIPLLEPAMASSISRFLRQSSAVLVASGAVLAAADGQPSASATSAQESTGNGAKMAIDGSPATIWHSQWAPTAASLPQAITLDRGVEGTVASLIYLPRPGGGNGTITAYNVYVSSDGTAFTKVVSAGVWPATGKRKYANFAPVPARYVRLECLAGVGNFASAAEISVSDKPSEPDAPYYQPGHVSVVSPAYGAEIRGRTTISLMAPGVTSATVTCWKQGDGLGSDATVATLAVDPQGRASFEFPADDFPHGPITVIISGVAGEQKDNCCLQLYNTGGVSWKEGLPKAPAAAEGMTLIFADDFAKPLSISSTDATARYYDHKPPNGSQDFSSLRFTGFDDPANPFAQVDTYLRIRADEGKGSSGLISSMRNDATGITATAPCYFECRMNGANAPGAWPAFWLLSDYMTDHLKGKDVPCDELDVIEAYGGEGKGSPNAFDKYCVTPHAWAQGDAGKQAEQAALKAIRAGKGSAAMDWAPQVVSMRNVGIPSTWYQSMHVYAVKITVDDTIYYCDDIEIGRHKTLEISKKAPFFFLINNATGGGWPVDLSRYGGIADMYVDYVRVYSGNQGDIDRLNVGK